MSAISPVLGRSERRAAAARYVEGLLLEGKRKSIEPLAQRLGVHATIGIRARPIAPGMTACASRMGAKAIAHLEPIESWIVDETAWVKQGRHSVGSCSTVLRSDRQERQLPAQRSADGQQRCGRRTGGRAPAAESWASDWVKMLQGWRSRADFYATKAEIALQLIDQALNDKVPQGPILRIVFTVTVSLSAKP